MRVPHRALVVAGACLPLVSPSLACVSFGTGVGGGYIFNGCGYAVIANYTGVNGRNSTGPLSSGSKSGVYGGSATDISFCRLDDWNAGRCRTR